MLLYSFYLLYAGHANFDFNRWAPKVNQIAISILQERNPSGLCEIATARKLKKWDYLEKISKELGDNEDINVDILIGANCLEALEPVEVIPRQNDGLYAIRTAFGWCAAGPIKAQCHHQFHVTG